LVGLVGRNMKSRGRTEPNKRKYQRPNFQTFKEPKNRSQGINSARHCSKAGRYDNPIPTRFLTPIDCLKLPAQSFAGWNQTNNIRDLGHKKTKTMPNLSGCVTAEHLAHFEAELNEITMHMRYIANTMYKNTTPMKLWEKEFPIVKILKL
jgi:hypothetical protein